MNHERKVSINLKFILNVLEAIMSSMDHLIFPPRTSRFRFTELDHLLLMRTNLHLNILLVSHICYTRVVSIARF